MKVFHRRVPFLLDIKKRFLAQSSQQTCLRIASLWPNVQLIEGSLTNHIVFSNGLQLKHLIIGKSIPYLFLQDIHKQKILQCLLSLPDIVWLNCMEFYIISESGQHVSRTLILLIACCRLIIVILQIFILNWNAHLY